MSYNFYTTSQRAMAIARGMISYQTARRQHVFTPSIKPPSSCCQCQSSSPATPNHQTMYSYSSLSPSKNQSKKSVGEEKEMNYNYSEIVDERKAVDEVLFLKEEDIEEKFVRGSGPGGQKVNKTSNCVELKHKASGIIVKCHDSRSLEQNRKIARSRLLEKLRFLFLPSESATQKKIEEKRKRKSDTERKRKMKQEAIESRVEI